MAKTDQSAHMDFIVEWRIIDLVHYVLRQIPYGAAMAILAAVAGYFLYPGFAKYEAETLVAPVATSSGAGRFGASLPLSILGFGSGNDASSNKVFAVMFSPELVHTLDTKYNLVERLINNNQLDDKKLSESELQAIRSDLKAPDIARTLKSMFQIVRDRETGFHRITVRHKDPEFARWLLTVVVQEADAVVRDRAQRKAMEQVDYLVTELTKTNNVEDRKVIRDILQGERTTLMTSSVRQHYAVETIIEPFAGSHPSPSRKQVVFLFGVIGGFAGIAVGFLVSAPIARFLGVSHDNQRTGVQALDYRSGT